MEKRLLLLNACEAILNQLQEAVVQCDPTHYVQPVAALSGSTIGQHLRHTLEFFLCLKKGVEVGVVCYDKRKHDMSIETEKEMGLETIATIRNFLRRVEGDVALGLEMCYERNLTPSFIIDSNLYREISYNIEHAVHHMALIKIGIREVAPYISLPEEFGVAVSTLRYQDNKSAD